MGIIFSNELKKSLIRNKRIDYNLIVMRQSACSVINPIIASNFADLFNGTPVERVSDSMMAPT